MLFGSHLDSQPSGGKFDGALGVLAGLEVMRTLNDLGITTEAPLELVNWTDEEGSRFGTRLMGSGVWAGAFPLDKAYALTDAEGVTVRTALDGIGYRGGEPRRSRRTPISNCISSRGRSSSEGKRIGIVTGRRRWSGTTRWRPDRTRTREPHRPRRGRTPWSAPRGSSIWSTASCGRSGDVGRGTVGELHVAPNSRNVIPGEVRFSVEFRHPEDAELDRLDAVFQREAGLIAGARGDAGARSPVQGSRHSRSTPGASSRKTPEATWSTGLNSDTGRMLRLCKWRSCHENSVSISRWHITARRAVFIVPCVVHSKLDHYAAMVRQEGDRYLLQDPRSEETSTYNALKLKAAVRFDLEQSDRLASSARPGRRNGLGKRQCRWPGPGASWAVRSRL